MNIKTFLIGSAIIIVTGILFCIPVNSIGLFIPSLSISGILGGIYAGFKRKRPLMNCAYDGFVTSLPASIILGLLLIPLLWIYHDTQNMG
ncbi:MAG: DUF5518 domain-containing protein, partial [Candidatus Thorarchaeota archaeon]